MIGLTVNYEGWAAILSNKMKRNLWAGSRPFGRSAKHSYAEALLYWHRKILPGHFERKAHYKYGYQNRKRPYLGIKRRLGQKKPSRGRDGELIRGRDAVVIRGGRVSIVRSGQTSRLAQMDPTIRAYPTYAILTMRVPSYITIRHQDATKPSQDQEITKLLDPEVRDVSRFASRIFKARLRQEGRVARRRRFKVPA